MSSEDSINEIMFMLIWIVLFGVVLGIVFYWHVFRVRDVDNPSGYRHVTFFQYVFSNDYDHNRDASEGLDTIYHLYF